jgi:Flp pilus assembly protein TadD
VAPPAIVVHQVSDADLEQAWLTWKRLESGSDVPAEQAARAQLLEMKRTIGSDDADAWAMGLARIGAAHEARGDSGAAVEIGRTATELAPSLPSAWVALARAYFQADPTEIGRYLGAMVTAVGLLPGDPRFSRPVLADFAATALLSLIFTAMAVVGVLFIRRAYYFFYDFHFFFPRAAARWQTTALGVLLLSLPIVFRMGVVPSLLTLFAATSLYLSQRERVVAAVLVSLLGFVPLAAGLVVDHTAFADTAAEDLFLIERGGPSLEPLVQKWETLASEDKVSFAEHYVLGRHNLRRGKLELALTHFRKALALSPEHVGARVNLGVTFFLQGDLENSRSVLEGVSKETRHPVALFDLARLYQRRVAVYGDSVAGEVDKSLAAFSEANQKDPSLPRAFDEKFGPEINGNLLMRTVPLEREQVLAFARAGDSAARVRSQLTLMLLGEVPEAVAPLYPLVLAALLAAFGSLGLSLRASRECSRCGKAVSHRGDPDVAPGSQMCTQCVNVFAKKNVVAPSLKVRKQLEVARYQNRVERTGLVLGALWSGMGHVFSGSPARGALYGFVFVAALTGAVMRNGLLRTTYDSVPVGLKLVPLVVMLVLVYVLSLRALRRRQS